MTTCPHFPFPDRPGVALDPGYLSEFRGQPLIPVQLRNGREALLVTRYADVKTVLSDARFSRQAWADGTLYARKSQTLPLAVSDPPLHTRRRRAVQAAFTQGQAELDRPWIRAFAEELADRIEPGPVPVDLVERFIQPFTYGVICRMLGLPDSDIPRFQPWVDAMMSVGRFTEEVTADAHQRMHGYFAEWLRRKQAQADAGRPADDLLTRLLAAPECQVLSTDERVAFGYGLLIGAGETTHYHLSLGLIQVIRDPALARTLRGEPETTAAVVEELLRWVWFAGTGGAPHVALEAVELTGGHIEAGQVVIPLTDAANRDASVFEDADQFRIDRPPKRHMGFGIGRHMCLGAPHARVELQEGLGALLRRFSHLELELPDAQIEWHSDMFVRGVWKLPVRCLR